MQPTSTTQMLCFGTTRGTTVQGPWAVRLEHRGFSVGGLVSLEWSFVGFTSLYKCTNFKLNRAPAVAEWHDLCALLRDSATALADTGLN